ALMPMSLWKIQPQINPRFIFLMPSASVGNPRRSELHPLMASSNPYKYVQGRAQNRMYLLGATRGEFNS
ncbi:hypothetical protein, partial [Moorena sp. SIO3I6]|uniref:hypothetical protein n=1 Tax=Moorena sp. SIO3I6 TaxID=2607831 RepID=UPI0025F382FA